MEKFNNREQLIILKSLKNQLKIDVKIIEDIESKGKRAFVTINYIKQEFKQLVEKVINHSEKINNESTETAINNIIKTFN